MITPSALGKNKSFDSLWLEMKFVLILDIKGRVTQIEKALIDDRLRVSKSLINDRLRVSKALINDRLRVSKALINDRLRVSKAF